ncbi:hypothetical protein [Pandoraea sp. NPDC090278]|uniref:hypothetical protein n=1 Tax=Pandoraea sp. NPDC090278 TaxID=3364391 RepID=UPI00383AA26A
MSGNDPEGATPTALNSCELTRSLDTLCEADSRNACSLRKDTSTGELRLATSADQIADMAVFNLSSRVPTAVHIHFETAKNLYVYAWFVYRFYPVAEQQALASLEFALRTRLEDDASRSASRGAKRPRGLKAWLNEALKQGAIANDRFQWAEKWAKARAKRRVDVQAIQQMKDLGLKSIQLDYSRAELPREDFAEDWIGTFIETLPEIRNEYAHGSSHLDSSSVLRTFEIITELINQLFDRTSGPR